MSSDAYNVLISVFAVILIPAGIGIIREALRNQPPRIGRDKTEKARQQR